MTDEELVDRKSGKLIHKSSIAKKIIYRGYFWGISKEVSYWFEVMCCLGDIDPAVLRSQKIKEEVIPQ